MALRCDLIIRDATVFDGTAAPRFKADVGVRGDHAHRSPARPSDDDRDVPEGARYLLCAVEAEMLALVVERLAGPERVDDLERLAQPVQSHLWLL